MCLQPQPSKIGQRIFLSYGHRDATELALRVRTDLEAAGYSVWQDEKRIRAGNAWTDEIRQGLRESDLVVALLSPHAVRRKGWGGNPDDQDSVCLDEIEYAVDACRVPVLPAMAVSCEPPFRIYRLQYLDLRAWQESATRYDELQKTLVAAVTDCLATGRAPLRKWERLPEPWDFTAFLAERRRRFMGRTWLFDALRDRLAETHSPVILLTGSPGIGKSAFFASLVHANPGGQILAYHCCQTTTPATLSPAVFVRSVAAMIAARDPGYAAMLEHPETLAALGEANVAADPASAFEAVILNLLHKLPEPEVTPRLLVIDALDEALGWSGTPNLLDLLSSRLGALPAWLKIVATTRDEPPVKRRFRTATLLSLDLAKQDNDRDLSAYVSARMEIEPLRTKVGARRTEIAGKVLARGTGNFLVVAQTLDALESGLIDVDDLDTLAPGLQPLYEGFFDRLFKRVGVDFAASRTLLECILAAQEPPLRSELAAVTGLDAETDLAPMLARLASMVPPRDGRYSPYHKTLTEWLTGWNTDEDQPVAGAYYISTRRGHRLWADALMQRHAQGPAAWDVYLRRYLPIYLAGAGQWNEVAAVLLDLRFLEAKVRGPGTTVFDLVADFEFTLRRMPVDHERHRLVFLVSEILRLDATFLANFPGSLFQCLWNRGHWHDCTEANSFFAAPAESPPPPWEHGEPRLSTLVEQWRAEKTQSSPGHGWLRALRPMPEALGGTQRGIIRADSESFDSVAVSPDGAHIMAAMSEGGRLGVWDAHSGAQLALLKLSEGDSVHSLRFLARGPRAGLAAAVTWNGKLALLDEALQVVELEQATADNFGRVAVSPDGTMIATGDWKGAVALWAADTMTPLTRWQAHGGQISALEFSPCGKFLASGEHGSGDENKVCVWATAADPHLRAEASARHWVEDLCFSDDGQLLYWGDYQGNIERWAWADGERSLIREERDSPASVIRLLGQRLLCGVGGAFNPAPVEVWNLEEGRIEQKLDGHLFNVGDISLFPGTQRFVSAGDSTLRIWDLEVPDAIKLTTLEPEVDWVAFREPQGWVITASESSDTVWVRTLAAGKLVRQLQGVAGLLSAMALSHDGRWLASGSVDGSVQLWDLDSGKSPWQTKHHKGKVTAIAFSPDGRMLATGSNDGRLDLLAPKTGKLIRQSKVYRDDAAHCIAVSNNGRFVVYGGYSNLEILEVDTLKVVHALSSVTHYALWFAPGDEYLVGEGISQFGLAWNVATGAPLTDKDEVSALYDAAMLRAGRAWRWHSPGNIGYAQEYLNLIDIRSGASVATFPELQGAVKWHPGGRIWMNQRSRHVSLLQLEGEGP